MHFSMAPCISSSFLEHEWGHLLIMPQPYMIPPRQMSVLEILTFITSNFKVPDHVYQRMKFFFSFHHDIVVKYFIFQ